MNFLEEKNSSLCLHLYHKDFLEIPKILETPYVTAKEGQEEKTLPPYQYELTMLRSGKFDEKLIEKIRKGKKN